MTEQPAGNLGDSLAGLLGALGVAPSVTRDGAAGTAEEVLAARGHQARVVGLRWGVLQLEADARTAALLRYDRDAVLAAIDESSPGAVSDVVIRVRR